MDKLIHFDQTGFIRGRLAADNVRRLFHILEMAEWFTEDWAVLSLDAEKAFDRLEWPYLWARFLSMIQILYDTPWPLLSQAHVSLNLFHCRGAHDKAALSQLYYLN